MFNIDNAKHGFKEMGFFCLLRSIGCKFNSVVGHHCFRLNTMRLHPFMALKVSLGNLSRSLFFQQLHTT
jgi:hypothetical protein